MDDFSPAAVAGKVDALNKLLEARQQLANLITYMDGKTGAEELVEQAAAGPGAPADAGVDEEPRGRDLVVDPDVTEAERQSWPDPKTQQEAHVGDRSASKSATSTRCSRRSSSRRRTRPRRRSSGRSARWPSRRCRRRRLISADVVKSIEAIIAQLDKKLTEQINLILHHEDFQKLEGAWRGLHYLVNNTETDEMLKIRVLNISKEDLGKTLKTLQGDGLGSEPDLQEDLRGGVRPVRRRALRLPGRRLLLRPDAAGRGAARRDGADRRRGAHAVHRRRLADGHADGRPGRSWPTRAI